MYKIIIFLLSLITVGCTSLSTNIQPNKTPMIPSNHKTSIFYYYISPLSQAQPAALVSGTFKWQDGCLFLLDSSGEYMTPLFPELPKDVVKWDEDTKTLNLDGHIFKMGDHIVTNGGWASYTPNTVGGAEYERQGDNRCLMPTMVMVGTMDINRQYPPHMQ